MHPISRRLYKDVAQRETIQDQTGPDRKLDWSVYCTVYCPVYCTVYCTVYSRDYRTVYCAAYCTVECTIYLTDTDLFGMVAPFLPLLVPRKTQIPRVERVLQAREILIYLAQGKCLVCPEWNLGIERSGK